MRETACWTFKTAQIARFGRLAAFFRCRLERICFFRSRKPFSERDLRVGWVLVRVDPKHRCNTPKKAYGNMQGVFLPVRMTKDKPKSLCTGLFWAFWAMFGIWQASCACVRSIIELKSPGESREKSEPRPGDWVGIGLVGRGFMDGCMDLYGQVRWGESWIFLSILKLRSVEGRGKGDSRARPRMRLENMLLDL